MRVFDRYLGADVELPGVVEPGRYRLSRGTVLNRTIALAAGDLLWSDGGSLCDLDDEPCRTFALAGDELGAKTPEGVVDAAVQAVVEQLTPGGFELSSPVMPAQLGDLASPTELELQLDGVLRRGHLQAIASRPRMAMRYDSELLPVSRAKRLAHDAVTRLASHSEDWLRREITGVVPRTLKAEVSDDDVAIYENVVFARLLDRLEHVLRRRIREVDVLLRKQDQATALAHAERLDYRLRNALCSLWGLSFADSPVSAKAATSTRLLLQTLLGKVRQLKRCPLYAAIPPAHQVPLALRSTNVLQHDTHYRCLRPLWILAHAAANAQGTSAPERFAAEKQRGERFAEYVGLLVRHALSACKLVSPSKAPGQYLFGTRSLNLEWAQDQWSLRMQGETEPLCFVPAWRGAGDWSANRQRWLVFCHGTGSLQSLVESSQPGVDGVLNPLEFYGVKRIRQAVEQWLLGRLLAQYPFQVASLPTESQDRIKAALGGAVEVKGRGLVIWRGVSDSARRQVESIAAALHINASTRQALTQAFDDALVLSTCRVCGVRIAPASFLASADGFKAQCACGHQWTLKLQEGLAAQAVFQLQGGSRPFDQVGSLQLVFTAP